MPFYFVLITFYFASNTAQYQNKIRGKCIDLVVFHHELL